MAHSGPSEVARVHRGLALGDPTFLARRPTTEKWNGGPAKRPDNRAVLLPQIAMSFGPMPVQQHAFEQICTYLMSYKASRQAGYKVTYTTLGGRGQPQWGVDVVTDDPRYAPQVGQCKHKQGGSKLTFSEVLQELKKSDEYIRPIERFFFLTNSERDSQLQTKLVGYEHTRPDGTAFPVQLVYWADLRDLSFIPKDELRRLFPEQAYHARHFLPPADMEAVAVAYEMAPRVLQNWFSEKDLHEIECSPDSLNISRNLWQKINLFQQAVVRAKHFRLGFSTNGSARCVRELFRALPAIDGFAHTLLEFKKQLADLEGLNPRDPGLFERCSTLQFQVNSVTNNYRSVINGDTSFDDELDFLNRPYLTY